MDITTNSADLTLEYIGVVLDYDVVTRELLCFIPRLMPALAGEKLTEYEAQTITGSPTIEGYSDYEPTLNIRNAIKVKAWDTAVQLPDKGSKVFVYFDNGNPSAAYWDDGMNVDGNYQVIEAERYSELFTLTIGDKETPINTSDKIILNLNSDSVTLVQNEKTKTYRVYFKDYYIKSSLEPDNPENGDLWFNSKDNKLYLYADEDYEELAKATDLQEIYNYISQAYSKVEYLRYDLIPSSSLAEALADFEVGTIVYYKNDYILYETGSAINSVGYYYYPEGNLFFHNGEIMNGLKIVVEDDDGNKSLKQINGSVEWDGLDGYSEVIETNEEEEKTEVIGVIFNKNVKLTSITFSLNVDDIDLSEATIDEVQTLLANYKLVLEDSSGIQTDLSSVFYLHYSGENYINRSDDGHTSYDATDLENILEAFGAITIGSNTSYYSYFTQTDTTNDGTTISKVFFTLSFNYAVISSGYTLKLIKNTLTEVTTKTDATDEESGETATESTVTWENVSEALNFEVASFSGIEYYTADNVTVNTSSINDQIATIYNEVFDDEGNSIVAANSNAIEELSSANESTNSAVSELSKIVESINSEVFDDDNNSIIAANSEAITKLNTEVFDSEGNSTISALNTKVSTLETTQSTESDKISALEEKISALESTVSSQTTTISELSEKLAILTETLNSLTQSTSEETIETEDDSNTETPSTEEISNEIVEETSDDNSNTDDTEST